MTLSGEDYELEKCELDVVLIPLLVDDPLRELKTSYPNEWANVLIPLLVDDPLRDVQWREII